MSPHRTASFALIAGSLAGVATMAMHPTGQDLVRNATAGEANLLVTAAHSLALVGQVLLLAGALALTDRLRARRDLAVGGFVFFACGSVAVSIAGIASGFIAPLVLRGMNAAGEAARLAMMNDLHYTSAINQAFAKVYVMLAAAAFLLWSVAILAGREIHRGLGVLGIVLGSAMLLGLSSGHLRLDIHGFGAVVLGQTLWFMWAALLLLRYDGPARTDV